MPSERHALLIGTNSYDDGGLSKLRSPVGDVAALANVLLDPDIGGFEAKPHLIDATKREIEAALDEFFGEASPTDLLVAYLSCHGVLAEDGRLYFATRDTERRRLRATAISDWFVHDLMSQSRARQTVLILDCCHSGAFARGLARKGDIDLNLGSRFEGKGQAILTASTKMEFAFEGPSLDKISGKSAGSIFTTALVEGIETGDADLDGDGEIAIEELYDYLFRRVKTTTPGQTPGYSGDTRGRIVIARSVAGRRAPRTREAPTTNLPTLVFEQVWFRPEGTRAEDMVKMKAMTDRGKLEVWPDRLRFTGKWTSFEIADIEGVHRSRSGRDFINSFVIISYSGGKTAQFADGRNLGWSGALGGNRKMQEAIQRVVRIGKPSEG